MKIRNGFVANSSSSSFIVSFNEGGDRFQNLKKLLFGDAKSFTLYDHTYSTSFLTEVILKDIDSARTIDTQEELIESAERNNFTFDANTSGEYLFGDEEGTKIGKVFDYILRDGGESENFKWIFGRYYR